MMDQHPIENMMDIAFDSVRAMVDVDTVVGEAVETKTGQTIIPISRVSFGFAGGGGEYGQKTKSVDGETRTPFAGGSGAGVSITPVGFLVLESGHISLLRADGAGVAERLTELVPKLIDELRGAANAMTKNNENKGVYRTDEDED